jgi:hypothetical protein
MTLLFMTSACVSLGSTSNARSDFSVSQCNYSTFEFFPYEHIMYELSDLFVVRSLEGLVRNSEYMWPEGQVFHVQVSRVDDMSSVAIQLEVLPGGNFRAPDLAPGEYCLKVSAEGWKTVLAAVLVEPDARYQDKIEIEIGLGV